MSKGFRLNVRIGYHEIFIKERGKSPKLKPPVPFKCPL